MSSLPNDERYQWEPQWELWTIIKFDYGTGRWSFKEYMPRGWHPPQSHQQAEQGEQDVDEEEDNDEEESDDDQEAEDQEEAQGIGHDQIKPIHVRKDSHIAYSPNATLVPTSAHIGSTPAGAQAVRSNFPNQAPHELLQPWNSTGAIQHTLSQTGDWEHQRQQIQFNQTYQPAQNLFQGQASTSAFPPQAGMPHGSNLNLYSHDAQRRLPRGRGPDIQGTWNGPPTPHYEMIDRSFYVHNKDFFFEGRVFSVIMNETAGSSARTPNAVDYNTSASLNKVKYEDNIVYTNVRRFVVVRSKREFCFACPIFTYSGRATTKPGVKASEHGIVYSWGRNPELLSYEGGITKPSLPVVMTNGHEILDKASRIYYGIHHPIQYNVKVKEIGYIPRDLVPILIGNWREEDEGNTQQEYAVTLAAEASDDPETTESANSTLAQEMSNLSVSGQPTSGSMQSGSSKRDSDSKPRSSRTGKSKR